MPFVFLAFFGGEVVSTTAPVGWLLPFAIQWPAAYKCLKRAFSSSIRSHLKAWQSWKTNAVKRSKHILRYQGHIWTACARSWLSEVNQCRCVQMFSSCGYECGGHFLGGGEMYCFGDILFFWGLFASLQWVRFILELGLEWGSDWN